MSDAIPDLGTLPVYWPTVNALAELDATMRRDAAAVALAKRYARDIDEAQVISTTAGKVLRELGREGIPAELYDRVSAIFDRIEATAVLALLGPKLLVVLAELGMTPKARADVTHKGGPSNVGGTPHEPSVAELRRQRMARLKAT